MNLLTKSNVLKLFISLALGVLIIVYLQNNLSSQDKLTIIDSFRNVNYTALFLVVLTCIFASVLRGLRWKMLLNSIGHYPKTSTVIYSIFIMYLANIVFPRLGELMRCTILQKYEDVPIEKSIGTMIVERLIDMFSLGIVVLLTLYFEYDKFQIIYSQYTEQKLGTGSWITYSILGIIGLSVLSYLFIPQLKRFIHQKIVGIIEGLKSLIHIENKFLFFIYSIFIFVFYFSALYILYFSIEGTSHLSMQSVFLVLTTGTLAVGLTQAGIGAYQLLVTQTLQLYGISKSIGLAYSWIAWIIQNSTLAIGGIISWIILVLKKDGKIK